MIIPYELFHILPVIFDTQNRVFLQEIIDFVKPTLGVLGAGMSILGYTFSSVFSISPITGTISSRRVEVQSTNSLGTVEDINELIFGYHSIFCRDVSCDDAVDVSSNVVSRKSN